MREREREIERRSDREFVCEDWSETEREREKEWALAFDWSSIGNRCALFVMLLICKDQSLFVSWFFAWTATHTHAMYHGMPEVRSSIQIINYVLCVICEWRSPSTDTKCIAIAVRCTLISTNQRHEDRQYSCHIWNAINRRNALLFFFLCTFVLSKYTFFRNRSPTSKKELPRGRNEQQRESEREKYIAK